MALSGATAQLAISEPVGSYTIAAEYTGDANYAVTLAAAETSATLTVNQAATATSAAPGTATVSYGQSATFTATVSSAAGVPSDGSVQFLVNGVNYGSPVALSGATAQLAISEPVGSYTIAAEYTGDANYAVTLAAAETSATLTVNQAATATSAAPGTATVNYGQSATFTATVSSAAGVPPDGSVQFLVNGVDYGSPVGLSGATAQLAISEPVGSYTIAAEYTGDANYAVTLPAAETSATLTVNQAATATSAAPGTATVSYGQSATFTATVSSAAGVPSDGSVQFLVNGVNYGSPVALSGATAQLAISEPVGSYTIAAEYTGDANYAVTLAAAETSATLTVNQAATATSAAPGTATVNYGQSATFTATVSSAAGVPPDGSVQFLVNGAAYGSPVALSGATAQLAISEPVGSYTITAAYTGDANYAVTLPAAETSATLTVNQAATATSVAPGTATVNYGQSATFSATVSSDDGTPPDGSVQFLVNGAAYGSPVPLSGATAQLAIAEPAGSYTIAAGYTGDANYAATLPANETSATLTVNQAATATSVAPGTATVSYTQSVTFTATVSSAAGVPPDGSVQFLVNGAAYGSPVALSGATAQLAISEPVGSYTITAAYTGDANYAVTLPAAETSATLTVNQAATATSVAPGTATVNYGQSATFTATVSSAAGVPPDGSVQFLVNGVDYGSPVALSGATAQLAISEPVGSYTIAAEYTGDANYAVTLPAAETSATLTVNQAATATVVTPGTATENYGQSATFTATVSSAAGVPPDGSVQFLVNGVNYGSPVALSGATAQLAISEPVGSYTIAAEYTGDANYAATLAAAETSATLTVNQVASPATNLAISPNTGNSSGLTDTGAVTFTGKLSAAGMTVDVFDTSTNTDLGNATVTGTSFSLALNLAQGSHILRARAMLNGTYADAFFSVLVDTTPPTSSVNPLPARGTSLSFPVSVTGSDGGNPPSGIASFDIYVSINGGSWTLWTTVPAAGPTATYTGQSNTTYAFYSTATDNAGNTQAYKPQIEASTYLPDLTPPVTMVDGTSGSNPSTVNSSTGTFTLDITGNDPGGSPITYFEVFVSVDSGTYQMVNGTAIPAGPPDSSGNVHASIFYQGLTDGAPHTYSFYSIGLDGAGNIQSAPATPNLSLTEIFAQASPPTLQVTGLTVENGAVERSYIRYVEIDFNESDSQSNSELTSIVNSVNNNPNSSAAQDIRLYQYNLSGTGTPNQVSVQGMLKVIDHAIEIDFGAEGLGGSPNTTTADGYYEVDIKLPNNTTAVHHFYRLLGDVTGDADVSDADLNEIAAEINLSSPTGMTPLNADVNGDGTVSALDLSLATRSKGRKLGAGLPLG